MALSTTLRRSLWTVRRVTAETVFSAWRRVVAMVEPRTATAQKRDQSPIFFRKVTKNSWKLFLEINCFSQAIFMQLHLHFDMKLILTWSWCRTRRNMEYPTPAA